MNKIFKLDISANPSTLDPQQANDPISDTIIGNVFLGLTRTAEDGSVEDGAAYEYSVSEDGLVYDFKLREDIYWVSVDGFEAQCTAQDFVFGFRRLFVSQTQAARASEYYCIKNSEKYRDNTLISLGVAAKGDFELEITLETPNPRFLELLSEPPAMPCNEEFFRSTQGKYGLSAKCTPSNGSFYVRSWHYEPRPTADVNNLILSRNYKNAEPLGVCPSGLNFFIRNESRHITNFNDGSTHCIALSNDDKDRVKGKNNVEEFSNISCGLVFNRNFTPFQNDDFRKAMTLLVDREEISMAIPDFELASGVVPDHVSVGGQSYRASVGGACEIPEYDPDLAAELFRGTRSQLDLSLFTGARVIVCSAASRTVVSYILQEWQRLFGFYCTIETLNETDFKTRLKNGSYEVAVLELSGKYNSPAAYLEQFASDSSDNYGRFYDDAYDELIDSADTAAEADESAEFYKQAEQYLIDNSAFLPIFFKNEYFFTDKDSVDIVYNPFSKTIDFTKAKG